MGDRWPGSKVGSKIKEQNSVILGSKNGTKIGSGSRGAEVKERKSGSGSQEVEFGERKSGSGSQGAELQEQKSGSGSWGAEV